MPEPLYSPAAGVLEAYPRPVFTRTSRSGAQYMKMAILLSDGSC